ncbi:hypothetical protein [Clostridium butyricum]
MNYDEINEFLKSIVMQFFQKIILMIIIKIHKKKILKATTRIILIMDFFTQMKMDMDVMICQVGFRK